MGRGGYASLAGAMPISSFGQDFLGGAAAGDKMRQVVGDIQVNDRMKEIGDAVTQAGGNLDEIKTDLFSDPVGLQALGEYTKRYTESTNNLQQAWKNHDQVIQHEFEYRQNKSDYFKKTGDPKALDELSEKLGMPYQTQYNPETQKHDVMYVGRFGLEPTGQSYTSTDLHGMVDEIGKDPKRFSQLRFQYAMATMRQNADYLSDPSKWLYDNDGKTVFVPRKMMTANGFRSGYIVTDTANKTSKFMTNEELQQNGMFPKDLQTMKGLFGIEKGRADMENDKVRLGYEGQRVSQGWAAHNLNRERFEYEKGDGLIPGMPGINRKGLKKTMDADFNQWMAAAGYAVKNGAFYKPEYNKDGSIAVDDEGKPKLRAMSPAEVGEARAEHQQDFVKRYTGQSAPGQGGDVGNILLSRGLEYKGGKTPVPPAGNGGNIPSQGKTSTEQPARLGGGMFGNSVVPTDKPQRAEGAKLSRAMPDVAGSANATMDLPVAPDEADIQKVGDKYYLILPGKHPIELDKATAQELVRRQKTSVQRWIETGRSGTAPKLPTKHDTRFAQMTDEEKTIWRKTGRFPDRLVQR